MVKMKKKPVFLCRISFGEISEINNSQAQKITKNIDFVFLTCYNLKF